MKIGDEVRVKPKWSTLLMNLPGRYKVTAIDGSGDLATVKIDRDGEIVSVCADYLELVPELDHWLAFTYAADVKVGELLRSRRNPADYCTVVEVDKAHSRVLVRWEGGRGYTTMEPVYALLRRDTPAPADDRVWVPATYGALHNGSEVRVQGGTCKGTVTNFRGYTDVLVQWTDGGRSWAPISNLEMCFAKKFTATGRFACSEPAVQHIKATETAPEKPLEGTWVPATLRLVTEDLDGAVVANRLHKTLKHGRVMAVKNDDGRVQVRWPNGATAWYALADLVVLQKKPLTVWVQATYSDFREAGVEVQCKRFNKGTGRVVSAACGTACVQWADGTSGEYSIPDLQVQRPMPDFTKLTWTDAYANLYIGNPVRLKKGRALYPAQGCVANLLNDGFVEIRADNGGWLTANREHLELGYVPEKPQQPWPEVKKGDLVRAKKTLWDRDTAGRRYVHAFEGDLGVCVEHFDAAYPTIEWPNGHWDTTPDEAVVCETATVELYQQHVAQRHAATTDKRYRKQPKNDPDHIPGHTQGRAFDINSVDYAEIEKRVFALWDKMFPAEPSGPALTDDELRKLGAAELVIEYQRLRLKYNDRKKQLFAACCGSLK